MHEQYQILKREYMRGWQTWNVNSVLSHVLMPEGFALNVCVREYSVGSYLKEALIGRFEKDAEWVYPGPHAYDGSYTALKINWRGISFSVETTNDQDELLILVTRHTNLLKTPMLCLEGGFLWNRPGYVKLTEEGMVGHMPDGDVAVYTTGKTVSGDVNLPTQTRYLAVEMAEQVVFSTGRRVSVERARKCLDEKREALKKTWEIYGDNSPLYEAMQCALAWDTIYDG